MTDLMLMAIQRAKFKYGEASGGSEDYFIAEECAHVALNCIDTALASQDKHIDDLRDRIKELEEDFQSEQEENTSLRTYIEELENTLGLRNRSNPDLTVDEEKPQSIFDRWKECKD